MAENTETEETPKRVVAIGVDGSENAIEAFQYYVSNVRKEGDNVYLIYAVEINNVLHSTQWYSSPYSFDREILIKLLNEEKERIKHKLEHFALLLKDAGIDGTVKSIHAETPGEGLCKGINETGASLVIVGSRGMGTLRRTFLGSVSDYVLHHAHVPVLICKHESDDDHHHHQTKDKKH